MNESKSVARSKNELFYCVAQDLYDFMLREGTPEPRRLFELLKERVAIHFDSYQESDHYGAFIESYIEALEKAIQYCGDHDVDQYDHVMTGLRILLRKYGREAGEPTLTL